MSSDSLIINIAAKSKDFEAALNHIKSQTKSLQSQLTTIAKGAGIAFAGLGATVVGTVTAFAQFDQQMRLVKTNLDDSSFGAKGLEQGFKEMTSQALELGRTMPISLTSTAGALFDTVSAGIDAGKAINVVAAAGKLATAGLTDVSVATDGLTSALNSFHIEASRADAVASKFYEAQLYGKTTVGELAGGLGEVSSTAANLGVSLNELLAATAAVTLGGKRTNEAFTGLKALLSNIAKPTADAQVEAQRLGIEFDATALRAKGLAGFLQSVTSAQGFNKDSAVKLFGSIQALDLAFSLTGSQAKSFHNILGVLNDDQKTQDGLNKAYEVTLNSLSNQWTLTTNRIQAAAIAIGSDLAPAASVALKIIGDFLNVFSAHKGLVEFTAYALAAGTALAGTVLTVTAGALAFIKIQGAIEAASVAFPLFGNALEFVSATMASAIGTVDAMTLSIQGLLGATGIGLLLIVIGELALHWRQVWAAMTATFHAFVDNIGNLSSAISNILQGALTFNSDQLKVGLDQAKQTISQSFAEISEKYNESENEKTAAVQKGNDDRQKIKDDASKKDLARIGQTNQKIITLQNQLQIAQREANQSDHDIQVEAVLQGTTQRLQILTNERIQEALVNHGFDLQQERQDSQNRIKYLKDEKKYGKQIADLKKLDRSQEFQNTKQGFSDLQQLTQSHNAALFAIGKAASIARAIISTQEGAIDAYTSLAGIPIIGPVLGAAAAAALIAYGVERVATISAQSISGYALGGIVTGGIKGIDSVPILAQPNEIVAPAQNFNEVVNSVADQRNLQQQARIGNGSASGFGEASATVVLELKDNLVEFIEAKLIERQRLGIAIGSFA